MGPHGEREKCLTPVGFEPTTSGRHGVPIIMGDTNAKVGADGREDHMAESDVGTMKA